MKKFAVLVSALLLAGAAHAEVSASKAQNAADLLKAINKATGVEDSEFQGLRTEESECNESGTDCAYNFQTDDEDFGIIVQYVEDTDTGIQGFSTDPNGVSLFDADFSGGLEAGRDSTAVSAKALAKIGKTIKTSFNKVLDLDFAGKFLADQSECRWDGDLVKCALNYQTDHENLGVFISGWISEDKSSIYFIDSLWIDPNGAWLN